MYELTICTKEGRELRRYELSGTRPIRIGRGIDCDIQIGVPEVSRRHAQLEFDDDEWIIKDLNSTHGVLIEGERVREATIEPGLEVTIGPAILRFENMAARIGGELNRMLGDDDDEESAETSPIDPNAHAETTHTATAELATAGAADAPAKKKSLLGFLARKKK